MWNSTNVKINVKMRKSIVENIPQSEAFQVRFIESLTQPKNSNLPSFSKAVGKKLHVNHNLSFLVKEN